MVLDISSIHRHQTKSVRKAASIYKIPRSTLQTRRAGITARRDCEPNLKKLTKPEEEVITRHILDLDSQGFPPTLDAVQNMADKLLAERGAGKVGKK